MDNYNLIIGLTCMDLADSEEEAEYKYLNTYKPFFKKLYEFPEIKVVIHFSGPLLEWLEEKHPEVIMLIEELVKKRKQVEVLGGGYYEPILPMLSAQDRTGQLESLTTSLRKKFGKRPLGCWITKSIWDNSLILPIRNSGMNYVFLDYSLLDNIPNDSLYTPFITEDSGKIINVFPVHSTLTALQEPDVEKYIVILKQKAGAPDSGGGSLLAKTCPPGSAGKVVSLIFTDEDIGKKPEEYVDAFFKTIQADKSIKTVHPSSLIKSLKLQKKYIRNSECYRNVLSENYEINLIYSRMIQVQTLINQLKGDKYKKESAMKFLHTGQNYLSYANKYSDATSSIQKKKKNRLNAYKNFMEAELLTRQKGIFIPSLFKNDFDMDGLDEFLFHGEEYNAFIHAEGASLFELDYLKNKWNYNDSIDYAACHADETENIGEKKRLKKSFCDYFVDIDKECANIADFINSDETGVASDYYSVNSFEREQKVAAFLCRVKDQKNGFAFKIVKQYKFNKKNFEVFYSIVNTGSKALSYQFGVGLFFSMIDKNKSINHNCENKNNKIILEDSNTTITINLETTYNIYVEEKSVPTAASMPCSPALCRDIPVAAQDAACFAMPQEDGTYCYTSIMPVYKIENLEPGKTWEKRIEVKL
ncbi:MAG: DUF1926 domain-containing protein [Spirochaetes bacterium]|nr:DUF1926 domain-containing protein [Spirochaetota bacterium]